MPYPTPTTHPRLQDALRELAKYDLLVLVDARRPVANFGYSGGPSQLVMLPDDAVYEFDASGVDIPAALHLLSAEVGGDAVRPHVNCRGMFCSAARPALPRGEPELCKAHGGALCALLYAAVLEPAKAALA